MTSTLGTRARLQEVANGVRVPDGLVEMAEEVPVVEIVQDEAADFESAKNSDGCVKTCMYHEVNGTKLELENGVPELLPEQISGMNCEAT